MIRVLHIIERLSRGGAGRALVAAAKYSALQGAIRHEIRSLLPPDRHAVGMARAANIAVDGPVGLEAAITAADIVQIHFWNTPPLYGFLRREMPACRLILVSHVGGDRPPHMVDAPLVALADLFVATTPHGAALSAVGSLVSDIECTVIPDAPDFARIADVVREPHHGFNVGYIGTVDFVKLHADFVVMSRNIGVRDARFIVCGEGSARRTLERQAAALGVEKAFDFRGYVEDISPVLAGLDVFGYPLCRDNYSTSELVLQEAMYAGVPPVVMRDGGAGAVIHHGETGLVVDTPEDYSHAVASLYRDPKERMRLGSNAARQARQCFGAEAAARQWYDAYRQLVARPKRWRPPLPGGISGAENFILSLGRAGEPFRTSLSGTDATSILAADAAIATASPALQNPGGGGIFHYRRHYPEDAALRYWAGLALLQNQRFALATAELTKAKALGFPLQRVLPHLARAAEGGHAPTLADNAIRQLRLAATVAPPLDWVVPRAGLGEILDRLEREPCRIAYLGNSVTAQRGGYRAALHRLLVEERGQPHMPINAGFGGVGSLGSVFTMSEFVIRHRPDLCFIECTTGDMGGATPLAEIGPAVEGMLRQLAKIDCAACLLHLYRRDQTYALTNPVIAAYEQVAEHFCIPSIHVGAAIERRIEAGESNPAELFRDVVHTTPAGAELTAALIAEALRLPALRVPGSAPGTPVPCLFVHDYRSTAILPATKAMLRDRSRYRAGKWRLSYPYLEIDADNEFVVHAEAVEVAGILAVVGPTSGTVLVREGNRSRCYALRDRWAHYERLHAVFFDRQDPTGAHLSIGLEDEASSACNLKLIGFLVRT